MRRSLALAPLLAALCGLPAVDPLAARAAQEGGAGEDLDRFFTPPEAYRGELGAYRSFMSFDDGTPVRTAEDWPRRRREILAYWHGVMGPWPPLVEKPRINYNERERVDTFTRHRVEVELVPGQVVGP